MSVIEQLAFFLFYIKVRRLLYPSVGKPTVACSEPWLHSLLNTKVNFMFNSFAQALSLRQGSNKYSTLT